MLGEHFIDPASKRGVVADLEQPFVVRDLRRRFSRLDHQRKDALRRGVTDRAVANQA